MTEFEAAVALQRGLISARRIVFWDGSVAEHISMTARWQIVEQNYIGEPGEAGRFVATMEGKP